MDKMFFNATLLEDFASREQHRDKRYGTVLLLLCELKKITSYENIEIIYSKGLLKDNKNSDLELIAFTKDKKILVIKYLKNVNRFEVTIQNAENIIEIITKGNLSEYISEVKRELLIRFDNGNTILLNSLDDSNDNWHDKYSNIIEKIIKLII